MKPIGYISEYGRDKLASKAHWHCLSVSKKQEKEFIIPVYEGSGVAELVEALEAVVEWDDVCNEFHDELRARINAAIAKAYREGMI